MTLLSGAVILASAAPASVDDESYLATLEIMGVTVDDPTVTIAMGHQGCSPLDAGLSMPAAVTQLAIGNGLTEDDAAAITGVSVAAYCDYHLAAVGH